MLRGEFAWFVITPHICGLSILKLGFAGRNVDRGKEGSNEKKMGVRLSDSP